MQAAIQQNSSDSDTFAALSPAQAAVATALAQGRSVTAAAAAAGVHRTTVHHWMRRDPAFKNALRKARRDYLDTLRDDLQDLAARALDTLRGILDNQGAPASVRLNAALAVLRRPQFPEHDWNIPAAAEPASLPNNPESKLGIPHAVSRGASSLRRRSRRRPVLASETSLRSPAPSECSPPLPGAPAPDRP